MLCEFTSNGALEWGTYVGGTGSESLFQFTHPLKVDTNGNLYFTGISRSLDFPLVNRAGAFHQSGNLSSGNGTNGTLTRFSKTTFSSFDFVLLN